MPEEPPKSRRPDVESKDARWRAEEALRLSEQRYRHFVENAHDIIYSHDLSGNYTSINRAGEQVTGYTREEFLKLNLTDTVAPEYLNTVNEMLRRKLTGEDVPPFEMDLVAKDGRRIAVEANTELLFQDGEILGIQGIARNVTERKRLEDQLRQSQKMEAIGQLAGGVAHDFNNLLTAINGYSSLALRRVDDNDLIKSYLEEVIKAGNRAANLTRQLLAFGRKQMLQPVPINLNDIVVDMNKMLRRLIGEDIQLSAQLEPALYTIKADPGQVEQVLVNLVVNARDAMPKGGQLNIETSNVEYTTKESVISEGSYVALSVTDTGTGMNAETQARVFEPFFTTKEKGKGTGLGLSTVYGIVKQSGGDIRLISSLDQGTTFNVYFPALKGVAATSRQINRERPIQEGSETILLVEDEPVVRALAKEILEKAGYSIIEASQGREALRFWDEHTGQIQLLLTDVRMPGLSGRELADRLMNEKPDLRVVYMSGYAEEAITRLGIVSESSQFLQKPFTPEKLLNAIRLELDGGEKLATSYQGVTADNVEARAIPSPGSRGEPSSNANQHGHARSTTRILLIDDEVEITSLLEDYLTKDGREIRSASSGLEAIELAPEFCPDVVFVDYDMGDLNGIQTVQVLRTLVPNVVPIMLTGVRDPAIATKAIREFVFDFLHKPFDLIELEHSLVRALAYSDAQSRSRRQQDFLSIVSHQLRAPLQAPLRYIGNFLSGTYGVLESQQEDRLKRIAKGLKTQVHLVNNLLDLSYLESERFHIRPRLESLSEVLKDVVDSFEMIAADNGVELLCSAIDAEFLVNIDSEHIKQAVGNLLANAIQHSSSGKSVELGLCQKSDELYLSIRDHGHGIPPPYLQRIFERSFQVPSNEMRKGLGIGLYVASEIAHAHSGRITVESTIGNGSIFTLVLPATEQPSGIHSNE
jgi:PAS domain S-box-containing protein